MADRKEELLAIMAAGYEAREELAAMERDAENAANAALLGKCQKMSNSYGSGGRWWLYRRILALNGSWCTSFKFQVREDGMIDTEIRNSDSTDRMAWIDITDEEFETAYQQMLAAIERQHAHRGAVSESEK